MNLMSIVFGLILILITLEALIMVPVNMPIIRVEKGYGYCTLLYVMFI